MVSASILYVGSGGTANLLKAAPSVGDQPQVPTAKNAGSPVRKGAPVQGRDDAKVTIVEFSDYECPYCRAFYENTLPQIRKQYIDTGKARLMYRDYPLSFHESAKPGAMAAQCANDQGKFWQFHDKIFGELGKKGQGTVPFSTDELKSWASQLGLDRAQFDKCLDSGKYSTQVDADVAAGTAAGVSGTPSFFINGQLLVGAQPFAAFKAVIDQALAK